MYRIEIPISSAMSLESIQELCHRWNCTVKPVSGVYYAIHSDDPINFFWLGANLAKQVNAAGPPGGRDGFGGGSQRF